MNSDMANEDELDLEAGRLLFAQECTFVLSAASLKQIPDDSLPEVAFAGRSNVGKSSLINALTGRKTLARASNTPGRTRLLNFFDLGGRLMIADLPGYGYARAPKTEIAQWTKLVWAYLRGRASLRRACLLVDARHGLKEADRGAMKLMDDAAVSYQIVLTKIDKIKPGALTKVMDDVAREAAGHVAAHPDIVPTSATTGDGIPELRARLTALAAPVDIG